MTIATAIATVNATDAKTEDAPATLLRRMYTRHTPYQKRLVVARLIWTAEEYDLIEELAEMGMTTTAMAPFFDPVPSTGALASAMRRAGIPGRFERGFGKKPSNDELDHWANVLADRLGIKTDRRTFRLM